MRPVRRVVCSLSACRPVLLTVAGTEKACWAFPFLTARPSQFCISEISTPASIRWEDSECCSGLVYIKIVFHIYNTIIKILVSPVWG